MNRSAQSCTLRQLADWCGCHLRGDGECIVHSIASIGSAKGGDVVFAADEARLQQALQSGASAIISGEFARLSSATKPILIHTNPKLAFARAATLLSGSQMHEGQDESAHVHPSAQLGGHSWIGPGAVIEENVRIGENTQIGPNCVIGAGVIIGKDCQLGPNVTLYSRTELRDRVVVQAGSVLGSTGFGYVREENGHYVLFPQIGRLLLEDDVEIGANCTVDRGALDLTVIRRGTKLDNLVHIGHNVEIGDDVVVAAQTGVSGSSRIGSGAIVGGQVGIADHVEIEPGVILGAQSGIPSHKVIRGKGIVFWGTPARPIKDYLKELATLARLTRKREK